MQSLGGTWKRYLWLTLMLVAMLIVACGGEAQTSPDAAEPAAGETPSTETAAPEGGTSADEYQAQRANCNWDTPCWPAVVETIPASFSEAPMLAEQVARGELPPVEERLPSDPLVIQPTEMIGEYGGTLRRAFTGPGDRPNIERWSIDHILFWDAGATVIEPRLAKAWESDPEGREWTFYLRQGMRWSNGDPFTADDFIFWYDHILMNGQLTVSIPWFLQWGGDVATVEKFDDYTVKITFAAPFPSFPDNVATTTVGGHFRKGRAGGNGGNLYAPRAYLEQFHPDFVGEEEATRLAQEAGFETWHQHFLALSDPHVNIELPVLTPWMPVSRISSDEYVLERNPYFWAVDTEGNQLPYIDRISMELVEELEVLNLRAVAGNYTLQERHIDFAKLPVFRENQEQGDYFIDFWNSRTRHPAKIAFNQDWNEDPEIAEFTVGSVDFRKALSLAIERDEINELFFLGVGSEASFCPADTPPYFNSDRWDENFGRFAPEEANEILDSLGLDQRDNEGFRLLPSGRRLVLRIDAVSGSFLDYPSIAEQIAQMWQQHVGVQLTVNPVERSLWVERNGANQSMLNMFETGEWNPAALNRLIPSIRWAPVAAGWANTPNPNPDDYDGPEWIKEMVLLHWEAAQHPDPQRRHELLVEATEIMCDNHARLGMVLDIPVNTTIIKNNVRNVAKPLEWAVYGQTPGNGLPEQFFILQDSAD